MEEKRNLAGSGHSISSFGPFLNKPFLYTSSCVSVFVCGYMCLCVCIYIVLLQIITLLLRYFGPSACAYFYEYHLIVNGLTALQRNIWQEDARQKLMNKHPKWLGSFKNTT